MTSTFVVNSMRAYGYAVWYEASFHDEASLGEFLRGAFGADFVRRAGSLNAEFRFSITRDVLKVSVQSAAVLYTAIDLTPRPGQPPRDAGPVQVAFAVGPGAHLLLEGMFQLDFYLMFGLRPQGTQTNATRFAVAASANLGKAF